MIFVLLIGLVLELIYCHYVFEKDLFSPSAILCEVFILSTVACIFNIDNWGVNLSLDTTLVILLGNAAFILVSSLIHFLYKKKHGTKKGEKWSKLAYIDISPVIMFLVVLAYLIFSVVYAGINVSILGNLSQGGDISQSMALYRHETVHGEGVLPLWLTRTNAVFSVGTYVLIFVFINNMIVDKKKKNNYWLLLAIAVYLFSSVFTAQRTTILLTFMFTLFVAYMLLNREYHFIKKINTKYVFRGALVVLAFLVLFGVTRSFFGRNDDGSAFDNVTYYMGNSIESLDLFIEKPIESKQFGEELFRQFRVNLSKYELAEETTMEGPHLEFRQDANGNMAGNVYTAYRYYIHDFGYGSIVFFQILLALFYGIWYERLNRRDLRRGIDLGFVVFAWFMIVLFRFSIMNRFFDSAASYLFTYWYMFLIWKILLGLKVSFGKRKISEARNG